jgi:hypothetical protein
MNDLAVVDRRAVGFALFGNTICAYWLSMEWVREPLLIPTPIPSGSLWNCTSDGTLRPYRDGRDVVPAMCASTGGAVWRAALRVSMELPFGR